LNSHDFDQIKMEFEERVNKIIWCNVATVDGRGRPRSRVLHPVWEGPIAWITTNPTSYKSRHLARVPYVSLAYIDAVKPAYADCVAEWIDDPAIKQQAWDYIRSIPEPMGFDPGLIYDPIDGSSTGKLSFGLLKLTPYRITLTQWPQPQLIWTPALVEEEGDSA
jgi:hypothetical protein